MTYLLIANVAALAVAVWAIWACRHSFRSRWDAPRTWALVFFALGAALDSPWRAFSEVSVGGHHYVLTVIGHLCYLIAAGLGDTFIYLRLLPDPVVRGFVRRLIVPIIVVAGSVMVIAFAASPATASLSAPLLYLVRVDGWLTVYWLTYFGAVIALFGIGIFGVHRLRPDPRSVMLNLLQVALILAVVSAIASAWGILSGTNETTRLVAWPIVYVAISAGALAVVHAWRHRVRSMLRPPEG